MEEHELMQQLQQKLSYLDDAVKQIKSRGSKKAETEQNYRVKLASTIAKLRANGESITLAKDMARGTEEVSQAKYEMEVADAEFRSVLEAIMVLKVQVKVIENQIEREWGQSKRR